MNALLRQTLTFVLLALSGFASLAQTEAQADTSQSEPPRLIELLYAGVLEGDVFEEEKIRLVVRDSARQVLFRHQNTLMYCDTAFQYLGQNRIVAKGGIRFIEDDSITLIGDTLYYDGNTRVAKLRGEVVMDDRRITVRTNHMNYDLTTKVAYYFNGGSIKDDSTQLISDRAYYNTETKQSAFKGNVRIRDREGMDVQSDTLNYDTESKIAVFQAQTYIKTRDGEIIAEKGSEINTLLGTSKIQGKEGEQLRVENEEYIISADFLDYDNLTEKGYAKENVRLYSKTENMFVYGDEGYYDGLTNNADVFGNALWVRPMGNDTLFLSADTLIARDDTTRSERFIKAYHNVRIFKRDMQGRCDSLFYDMTDSTIHFINDPVLWSGESQLSAKFIKATMKEQQIHRLDMQAKSFVISQNYFAEFDQIKGRDMTVFFKEGSVDSVYVEGNGESVYFLIDEQKGTLQGMNFIQCSNIVMNFADSNRLDNIVFLKNPTGKVFPPHKITHENKRLDAFQWRKDERPTRSELLGDRVADTEVRVATPPEGDVLSENSEVFDMRLQGRKLFFFAATVKPEDLEGIFFVYVKPVSSSVLPLDKQEIGLERLEFSISADQISDVGSLEKGIQLPSYPILRIQFGQRLPQKGVLWQGEYYFFK